MPRAAPDDPRERFDVLDDAGLPTGRTATRAEVHRDGLWHRALHLWVVREGRTVLMQRRSPGKDIAGGRIDVTVGGHLRAGETLPDALRETEEEIGLIVRPGQLAFLGTRRVDRRYPNAIDREWIDVYWLADDRPLGAYHLDCREVEVLYELPLERAVALYRSGSFVPAEGWDCQQRTNNALLVEDDLIPQARDDTLWALEALLEAVEADAARSD